MTEHLDFIRNLEHFIELEEYIFVHAGVHPNQPIEETDPYTLMWIREEFYKAYSGEKTVIFGHTPTKNLHDKSFNLFWRKSNHRHRRRCCLRRTIKLSGIAQSRSLLRQTQQMNDILKCRGDFMTNKKYEALVPDRIFIGGIDAIDELLENEKIDVIYDLRAEVKGPLSSEISIHQPIVDEADNQDESIKAAVTEVMNAYNSGKNVYFHCNTGRGRAGTIATATLTRTWSSRFCR